MSLGSITRSIEAIRDNITQAGHCQYPKRLKIWDSKWRDECGKNDTISMDVFLTVSPSDLLRDPVPAAL